MACTAFRFSILTTMWLLVPLPALAQYFGQNKVQYEQFDFRVLRTEHFDIYFYPQEREGVDLASRMAERWNTRLTRLLDHQLSSRQPLILYASSTHFQQTNVVGGQIGEGTGGVTEGLKRRVVMPFAGPLADTDHVLGHELVHAYQYDISDRLTALAGSSRSAGLQSLPLWFVEGMAEYLSIGAHSPLTSMWVRDAILAEKLPTIGDLSNPEYFPYRWGHAFWAYVAGRWGDRAVRDLLYAAIRMGDEREAFEQVLEIDHEELSKAWHAELQRAYAELPVEGRAAKRFGRLLTPPRGLGGDLNVSPALSPDGTRVAFLSERGLFSVELYVADVETGEVVRRLTSTAVDPHLSSLQFIASAGAWNPQGTRLAVTAVSKGQPQLIVYEVSSGDVVSETALSNLDAAFNPAWSPDGETIALVGMTQGLTDLFTLDVASATLTQLTDDAYTELHPAWSPDGRTIAIASDRATTNLSTLDLGELRLALFDVTSRQVRALEGFPRGKHINPQWARDGRSVYFVADPDGISNVYRVGVDGGGLRQVTQLYTGASGITATSPVISAAAAADRLVFTVFDEGDQRLYVAEHADVLTGMPVAFDSQTDAGLLPPRRERAGDVSTLLENATLGLPPPTSSPTIEPYSPSLQLDFVGQPAIAVGADRWGAFGGGGLSFFMSDLLGDHSLGVMAQAVTSFDQDFSASDIGGAVVYRNLSRRWNWGVAVDQTPYRSGYVTAGTTIIDNRPVAIEEAVVLRQADRGVTGLLAYPLSRAQRVELSAGARNLSFSQRSHVTAYTLDTGEILLDESQDAGPSDSLNLGLASAALVYDTSSFGATSPVLGQRYRFEVSPTIGDIRYTGVLLDYRRYFMPVQLYTIAARVMHYGRYGAGGEDLRLSPLYLGYPSLVRGYDTGSFQSGECPPTPDGRCAAFDRLIGSRIAVANLELRFPLLRPFGVRGGVYGPIPVEAALFADAGIAWDRNDAASTFYRSDADPITSVGAALRVNAFGFAILQFNVAKPLQREGRGWLFQFSMTPGF